MPYNAILGGYSARSPYFTGGRVSRDMRVGFFGLDGARLLLLLAHCRLATKGFAHGLARVCLAAIPLLLL
jgi:hypothetical protein